MTQRVAADHGSTANRGSSRFSAGVAVALFALAVSAGQALADGGGVGASGPPEVTDVVCSSDCEGPREATAGSLVRVEGKRLGATERVSFAAEAGGRSEVRARQVSGRSVAAAVPDDAASGRVVVIDGSGTEARSPRALTIAEPDDTEPGTDGEFELTSVEATPAKAFYGAERGTRVKFSFDAGGPTDVRVAVRNRKSDREVDSFVVRDAEPFADNTARWDGRTADGRVLDSGHFAFTVSEASGNSRASADEASARFDVFPNKFPVRGKHGFGDGFGAGRGHQGADIFADCGTRMVAARAGKVQYSGFQSSAGNYVVIDTKGSGVDHAYMHLKQPSKVREGEKVETGQTIGKVGETGNAQGCHLHFEIWSAPGWYEGGSAQRNVMRQVKKWDGWS